MEHVSEIEKMALHVKGSAHSDNESVAARWRVAYAKALKRSLVQESPSQHLVQLLFWPNLSRLPEELVAPVTRICALLWRKPTVCFLVPRVLKTSLQETCALLFVLQEFGHVTSPRQGISFIQGTADEQEAGSGQDSHARTNNSLFGKLWSRLVGS